MNVVDIEVLIGGEIQRVTVSAPAGMGGDSYHIMVGGYYNGAILHTYQGEWRSHINEKSSLTPDDVESLIAMVKETKE